MKVYAGMDPRLPLAAVPAYAQRVERLGFDGLHVAETVHDSLAVSLLALEHTSTLTVRTAVTLAFVRSPTLVAYAAWDLARMSGGRFELGLGTQIKQNIEGRFAMPWSEPTARMREYVGALHALYAAFGNGGPLRFDGDVYRLTRLQPFFNPGPDPETPAPPTWLGAVNPGMCRLAGAVAAGVVTHPTNSDPDYLADVVRPEMRRGAEEAGRDPAAVRLVAATTLATGADDAAVRSERERQRRLLAFLYSTPAYRPTLDRHGWSDVPARLQELVRADRWEDLPAVLTDEILDLVLTCGRYDELAQAVVRKFGDLADGVALPPLGPEADDPLLAAAVDQIRQDKVSA